MLAVIAKDAALSARLLRDLRGLGHEAGAYDSAGLDVKGLARLEPAAGKATPATQHPASACRLAPLRRPSRRPLAPRVPRGRGPGRGG